MDISVGDVIEAKKPHPCGCKTFDVLRTGADVKLRCRSCGREIMLPRLKAEKAIKRKYAKTENL